MKSMFSCGRGVVVALAVLLVGCANVPDRARVLAFQQGQLQPLANAECGAAPASPNAALAIEPLPAGPLRVLSWNVFKGQAAGWQADLMRHAAEHDLLLLQEAVLEPDLRAAIEGGGQRWQMAAAFAWRGVERGVMNAARATPVAVCTVRSFEPLLPLPKSALVARYALHGRADTLAVANLHGVNFELGAARFRAQIEAVAAELATHRGPVILAGDFNAWSESKNAALEAVAERLKLQELRFDPDFRRAAFGRYLDRFFVRGLVARWAVSPPVTSSDHNPLRVVLDVLP